MMFAHPYLLLLLLLLPLAAWLKGRRGQPPAFVYSSVQLLRGVQDITKSRAGGFLAALRWLALALLIIALAQPRFTKFDTTKSTASGIDMVVAFDLSGSMEVPDFVVNRQRVNRFEIARAVLKQFIDKRPNDRIGLVVFGGNAYIGSPLTLDHDFLQKNIDRLHLHMIEDNTAIGTALSTAVNRLRELKSKSKIVILMTDGANNAGKIAPLTAAEAAQALRVKVYTIGVGNKDAVLQMGLNPGLLPDEDTLEQIAKMTGGKFYRADNTEHFQQIYTEIDKLEKTEAEVKKFAQHTELFGWFISTGLAVLLVEVALGQTVLRRLP
ncbi:MAG: VWA domain-containing protein [Verrucomicrobia bacterium]|nr:MAG: VWA domain-containing protein [Verrucomicrobiota bacterium]